MFHLKLLFIILPLTAIHENTAEIINERYGSSSHDNSPTTPYSSNELQESTALRTNPVLYANSPNNFSPVPLRHVPKPISYGSYGIAKVIPTTPLPRHEAEDYVTDPSKDKLYAKKISEVPLRIVPTIPTPIKREQLHLSNNYSPVVLETVSGAPLRFVSTPPTPIKIEQAPRDVVITVDPTTQHVQFGSQHDSSDTGEIRLHGSSIGQIDVPKQVPQSRSVGHEVQFVENAASAPVRHVPKDYGAYESPRVTTPSVNEKVVKVTPKPKYNNEAKLDDHTKQSIPVGINIEHVTPTATQSSSPLPVTSTMGTATQVTEVPLNKESILVSNATMTMDNNPLNHNMKEMRLDFSCNGIDAFYSIERNCDQFVECKDDVAKLYRCPPGLHFNSKTVWPAEPCEDKYIVGCDKSLVPPKPSLVIITVQLSGYNCGAGDAYYSYENNCEQFVECKNNIATLYACPRGWNFNNGTRYGENPCAIPSVAPCHKPEPKFSASLVSRRVPDYDCPSSDAYIKINNECEQFIKCERSIASSYKCFAGLQFNQNALWGSDPCSSASEVRCQVVIPPAPKFSAVLVDRLEDYICASTNGYFKLDNECEKFIKCEHSIASTYKCLPGLQFNRNAAWNEDPCESEAVVSCLSKFISPETKFSANLIATVEGYTCPASDGYYRDGNNCGEFIKCEHGVAFSYECFPGLQYNHNAKLGEDPCASKSIVGCSVEILPPAPQISADLIGRMESYTCPSSNGYFRLDNDCEQFIKCEGAIASKYKCSSGLQFKHDASWEEDPCASESIVRCRIQIIPPAPQMSAVLIGITESYTCPSSHGYFRLDNDCEQFIRCERSTAFKYKCSSGLQFKHDTAWEEDPCVSESIVRCRIQIIPPAPKFSADLIGRIEGYVCASSSGYFRWENECEQFVKCENSLASLYKCFTGLQFNHNARWHEDPCAPPSIAHCEIEFVTPAILITPHIDYYTCDTPNGYFKIENDCEQFIECKRSIPSLYKCPDGLQFSSKGRWGENPCASAAVVRCQVVVLSYTLIMEHVTSYACPASIGYFPVAEQCEQFIKCQDNIPSLYQCNDGLHFNRYAPKGADLCATKSVARCEQNKPRTTPKPIDYDVLCPKANGNFPLDHLECSKYVVCKDGMGTVMTCPKGLVFNATVQACDWPISEPACEPKVFKDFTCPAPRLNKDEADEEEVTTFRYHDSCKRFVACKGGYPRLLSCDVGRYYDEETRQCINSGLVHNCKEDM